MAMVPLATQQILIPSGNGSSCYPTDRCMDDSRRALLTELTDQLPGQGPRESPSVVMSTMVRLHSGRKLWSPGDPQWDVEKTKKML